MKQNLHNLLMNAKNNKKQPIHCRSSGFHIIVLCANITPETCHGRQIISRLISYPFYGRIFKKPIQSSIVFYVFHNTIAPWTTLKLHSIPMYFELVEFFIYFLYVFYCYFKYQTDSNSFNLITNWIKYVSAYLKQYKYFMFLRQCLELHCKY